MNAWVPTARQRDALWLRYHRGATIAQIAAWLNISRRAVFYRLRNARRRASAAADCIPAHLRQSGPADRRRLYNASQISVEPVKGELNMDEL